LWDTWIISCDNIRKNSTRMQKRIMMNCDNLLR
jgi:mannitol-1-phosphate/altronate dehydrogenase